MILVAGLAVVGLAGIAAAFYFSMHPGASRVRAAGPGQARDSRVPADKGRTSQPPVGRSDRSAGPARSAKSDEDARAVRSARSAGPAPDGRSRSRRAVDRAGSSTVIDFTGPQPVLDDPEPVATGRRARRGDHLDDTPDEPTPGRRAAARRSREADADDADQASRSRLRMAWRKGSDVDEELWPTEAFGGVSDEQFWNDLAADKPLATTARTAQPDSAPRRRPPGGGPLPDLYPAEDRGRADGRRGAPEGPGTHPQPHLGADDRTALQPVYAGTQPSPTSPGTTQPYPSATQPTSAATQPVRATHQPAESRGRSRSAASADEDPLTSPAYSLRPKGSVNGQSYQSRRSQDLTREQYQGANGANGANGVNAAAGRSDVSRSDVSRSDVSRSDGYRSDPPRSDPPRSDPPRPGSAYGGTVPSTTYPYPQQPYSKPTQSMYARPQGERYRYGNPGGSWAQASPGGAPGRANGGWDPSRTSGNGAAGGNRSSRPAYPPANGYRPPYDPRGYDRR